MRSKRESPIASQGSVPLLTLTDRTSSPPTPCRHVTAIMSPFIRMYCMFTWVTIPMSCNCTHRTHVLTSRHSQLHYFTLQSCSADTRMLFFSLSHAAESEKMCNKLWPLLQVLSAYWFRSSQPAMHSFSILDNSHLHKAFGGAGGGEEVQIRGRALVEDGIHAAGACGDIIRSRSSSSH